MKDPHNQWEYLIVNLLGVNATNNAKLLSDYGKGGWELVAVGVQQTTHFVYLKRPVSYGDTAT